MGTGGAQAAALLPFSVVGEVSRPLYISKPTLAIDASQRPGPARSCQRKRTACLAGNLGLGWTIGRITARETGIPRGMAYLTGFVVQAAIDDELFA